MAFPWLDVCYLIVGVIMHASMVAVGASYTDGMDPESDCKFQAVYFLKVAGGFLLTMDILESLYHCFYGSIGSEKRAKMPFSPICGMVNVIGSLVIFIWGSVIVFEPYQDWIYDEADRENNNYCAYTPYTFSIFFLILGWCFTAIRMIFICLGLLYYSVLMYYRYCFTDLR